MNDDSMTDGLKQAWQAQPATAPTITLDDVKRGAEKFQFRVGVRNLIEYAAAVFVVISYSQMMTNMDKVLMKVGCVLIVIATLYVVVQIHVRMSQRKVPREALGVSLVEFHRAAVLREIAGLRSVARWYLLPFLPGWTLFIIQSLIDRKYIAAVSLVAMAIAIGGGVVALNRWGARQLQAKLSAMEEGLDPERRAA